jgi:hypothetical protein
MSDADKPKENPVEGGENPVNLAETRTGIMLLLAPAIDKTMAESTLDLTNVNILRRFFRAMIHLAIKKMLDAGAPPQFLLAQTVEAINHELEARAKQPQGSAINVPPSNMVN